LPRSTPSLLRAGFGQHIPNGIAVGAGVGLVGLILGHFFGFTEGMAAGTGAICVSIGDLPNPLSSKLKILPVCLVLACASSFLIALTLGHPLLQGVIVVAVSAGAGMLVGYGRWALPVSVLTMLALVFTLGTPMTGLAEAMHHQLLFAAGGFLYMLIALAVTRATERSNRRIAVAETLREFALYLRAIAKFYDERADLGIVYRQVVEQQAALADHLQAARQQVFTGSQTDSSKRLTAAIILQVDALDTVVSAHADLAPLRRGEAGRLLPALVGALISDLAGDLERLSEELLRYRKSLSLRDRTDSIDLISQEVSRLTQEDKIDPRALRAARATRTKLTWVADHLSRLPKVLQSAKGADTLLAGIDLSAFVQPLSMAPGQLAPHFTLSSPVARHAVRIGAAMGCGYVLIQAIPGLSHGNWILLTIAVILRAQYSVTRQRRNDRLIGNLIGCVFTAGLLRVDLPELQLAVIPLGIAIAHAYVRVNYLVTSTAACIMALLSLHFLDPTAPSPLGTRMLDTAIGAAIAFLFSRLLPRWEYQEAPKLVDMLMKSFTAYMSDALKIEISEQSYRLKRKTMLESLAAITESASRVAGEPRHAQSAMPADLGTLLAAAYSLAAQIVGIRVLLRNRKADINPLYAEHMLDKTRRIVLGQLDLSHEAEETPELDDGDESHVDAEKALRIRCRELCAGAANLHEVAAQFSKIGS
jgi:uncharacterized membrane protein YccC